MNIGQLRKAVAKFCGKDVNFFIDNGEDLLIAALNGARLEAEQVIDFEYAKVYVDLEIDGTAGGSIHAATLHGGTDVVSIKTVLDANILLDNGELAGVSYVSKTGLITGLRDWKGPGIRYPSDAEVRYSEENQYKLIQQGELLYFYPFGESGETATAVLDVIRWMPEYDDDEDEDFLCKYCSNYLKWAAVVELNHLSKNFVPRTEGNLAPPTTLKDNAFAAMQDWNDHIVQTRE